MLEWLTLALLVVSHGAYLAPFIHSLRFAGLPRSVDFVGVSAVLYFDLGVAAEAVGRSAPSPFFGSLFHAHDSVVVIGAVLMAAAPWLIRFGAGRPDHRASRPAPCLASGWRTRVFYSLAAILSMGCACLPLALLRITPHLWESRALLGELLGPWIIVLSLPLCLLAFYVRLHDARSRAGKAFLAFVLICSFFAALPMGERTQTLLPLLIVLLFTGSHSWKSWVVFGCCGGLCAALVLPIFKPDHATEEESATHLISETLSNDFSRAPELARVIESSPVLGTARMAYAGSGYVYAACFFMPRALVPSKGVSTAQSFTAEVTQTDPQSLQWGFGISAVSEAILNFGILPAPLILSGYGAAIAWLSRKCTNWRSLEVPLCLACLWIFGYHLPALLLNFGAMAAVGVGCEWLFTQRQAAEGEIA